LLELGIKISLREASSGVSGEQTQRLAAPKRGGKDVEAASQAKDGEGVAGRTEKGKP
jgi:hypothetical protein